MITYIIGCARMAFLKTAIKHIPKILVLLLFFGVYFLLRFLLSLLPIKSNSFLLNFPQNDIRCLPNQVRRLASRFLHLFDFLVYLKMPIRILFGRRVPTWSSFALWSLRKFGISIFAYETRNVIVLNIKFYLKKPGGLCNYLNPCWRRLIKVFSVFFILHI